MNFIPDAFVDGIAGNTPITATKLNNLETGVVNDDGTNPASAEAVHDAATFVPYWAANTFYAAGKQVVSPSGDVVTAKTAHTSSTTFSGTGTGGNWNLSTTFAPSATSVPKWQPLTTYVAGQQVVSPNGDVVSAITAFTSGASFTAANWNLSAIGARVPASPASNGPYDQFTNRYSIKPQQLRSTRTRIARQLSTGLNGLNIVCIGDSITAGNGSGTDTYTRSYPALLKLILGARGVEVSDGWALCITPGGNPTDSRFTYVNFSVESGFTAPTTGWVASTASGATVSFTSVNPGATAYVGYLDNSGAFTISVDGGAPATVTPGGTNTVKTWSVGGLDASKPHTILVTASSTTTVRIVGCAVLEVGKHFLSNTGIGASKTAAWATTGAWNTPGNVGRALNTTPNLVLIEAMIVNDGQTGGTGLISPADSQTNLINIVQAYTAMSTAPDVILIVPPTTQNTIITDANWALYRAAVYAAADATGVPIVDMSDRYGTWAQASTLGIMADSYHLNTYRDMAQAIGDTLVPAPLGPHVTAGTTVIDTFTRADSAVTLGTADSGQAWVAAAGTWGISSNTGYSVTATDGDRAVIQARTSNHAVSATVTGLTGANMSLLARCTDGSNGYVLNITQGSTTATVKLFKMVAGAYTQLGHTVTLPAPVAEGAVIGLTVKGSQLTAYVSSAAVISATDTTYTLGSYAGLRIGGSSAALRYDNFTVASA